MKKIYSIRILFLLMLSFIAVSCSSNDEVRDPSEEVFMNTNLNGIALNMNSKNSIIEVKKIVETSGLLQLEVKAISNGEIVKFNLPSYSGKNIYVMGENPVLPNTMEYEKSSPLGKWVSNYPGLSATDKNYIEITKDDGNFIEGYFNFTAKNEQDLSFVRFSQGNFKVWEH